MATGMAAGGEQSAATSQEEANAVLGAARGRHRPSLIATLRRQDTKRMTMLLGNVPWPRVGISLASTGGATGVAFCAGVLKELLQRKVRMDFLSTASSSSILGASYIDWKVREGGNDDAAWHQRFFKHMLAGLAPLQSSPSNDSGSCARPTRRVWHKMALLVNVLHIFLTVLLLGSFVFPILAVHGRYLSHVQQLWNALEDMLGYSNDNGGDDMIVRLGVGLYLAGYMSLVFRPGARTTSLSLVRHFCYSMLTTIRVVMFIVCMQELFNEGRKVGSIVHDTCHHMVAEARRNASRNISTAHLASLNTSSSNSFYGCNLLAVVASLSIPGVLLLVNVVLVGLVVGTRRSFSMIGLCFFIVLLGSATRPFSCPEAAWYNLLASGICLGGFLLSPIVLPYHRDLSLHMFEEALRRLYFHPSQGGVMGDFIRRVFRFPRLANQVKGNSKPKVQHQSCDLTLGDLSKVKPELITQVSLNNWRNDVADPLDDEIKILSVSSKVVDVIHHRDREDVSLFLDLVPNHLKLVTIMATSTPWVDLLSSSTLTFIREFFAMLSPRHIKYLSVWTDAVPSTAVRILKMIAVALVHFFIGIDAFVYLINPQYDPYVMFVGPVSRIAFVFFALYPSDRNVSNATFLQQLCFIISRWLVINVPLCHYLRSLANSTTIGPYPDFILELDHCSELEHSGLLALLKRRTNRIILADGGTPLSLNRAERILATMQRARKYLGCRFTTMEGKDVQFELYRTLGASTQGVAPQAFQFKVHYTVEQAGERVVIDDGEILILQPRHPEKTKKGEWSGDLKDEWDADEANELYGMFSWSSKHWLWKWLSESVHGKFPFHDARFLPTEAQVEAMFREGVRAMSAEAVQTFVNDLPKTDKDAMENYDDAEDTSDDTEDKSDDAEDTSDEARDKSDDTEDKSDDTEDKSDDTEDKSDDTEDKSDDTEDKSVDEDPNNSLEPGTASAAAALTGSLEVSTQGDGREGLRQRRGVESSPPALPPRPRPLVPLKSEEYRAFTFSSQDSNCSFFPLGGMESFSQSVDSPVPRPRSLSAVSSQGIPASDLPDESFDSPPTQVAPVYAAKHATLPTPMSPTSADPAEDSSPPPLPRRHTQPNLMVPEVASDGQSGSPPPLPQRPSRPPLPPKPGHAPE